MVREKECARVLLGQGRSRIRFRVRTRSRKSEEYRKRGGQQMKHMEALRVEEQKMVGVCGQ
jgi:hypothetical protein